jgi:hypothetical protein
MSNPADGMRDEFDRMLEEGAMKRAKKESTTEDTDGDE